MAASIASVPIVMGSAVVRFVLVGHAVVRPPPLLKPWARLRLAARTPAVTLPPVLARTALRMRVPVTRATVKTVPARV